MAAMLSVSEAQSRILAGLGPLAAEDVALSEADDRVLAAAICSRRTQPPFDASAMDGYAVRAADLSPGVTLAVVGESAAGHGHAGTLKPGEAVRIFTGAPVPAGADTVVIQENTRRDGASVVIARPEAAGRNIRAAGLDFSVGRPGLAAGLRLGPGAIALAAAMDHAVVPAVRRPLVAILATGDELVPPGSDAADDRIVASNTYGLAAMVRSAGGRVLDLGIAPDRLDVIRGRIREGLAAGADVLCLVGGASVGDHDLTRPALEAEGLSLDFWKLAMRPGKPLMFGRIGAVSALGLPGNPVSSLVCGTLFLAPLVRTLAGLVPVLPPVETARLGRDLPGNDWRQDHLRATLEIATDGISVVTPHAVQDSSMLSIYAASQALVIRPPDAPAALAGSSVPIIRL